MIRPALPSFALRSFLALACLGLTTAAFGLVATTTTAQAVEKKKTTAGKKKSADKKGGDEGGAKPRLLETFGAWGVYVAGAGKSKTCYALGKPSKRLPAKLTRDPGFVFISTRPGEGVRNEVSVILGYAAKDDATPRVEIGSTKFEMVGKGGNLWVRNPAEGGPLLAAMRRGAEMVVHATSARGNQTTDHFALSGLTQALDRVGKECK